MGQIKKYVRVYSDGQQRRKKYPEWTDKSGVPKSVGRRLAGHPGWTVINHGTVGRCMDCLLYTSDAADE